MSRHEPNDPHHVDPRISRRGFLGGAAGASAATLVLGPLYANALHHDPRDERVPLASDDDAAIGPLSGFERRERAAKLRADAARFNLQLPPQLHRSNGDDQRYPDKIGSYSKGLSHNAFGEVDLAAYASLITALTSGKKEDFEAIVMGNPTLATRNKLTNPQSGIAFDLEGLDSHQMTVPPAPAFASAEEAGEIVENYWMALLRDVPFTDYATDPRAAAACADLSALSDFRGPKQAGAVTPQVLFRQNLPAALVGPWVSQFFWTAQPFGAQLIEPRIQTAIQGLDYMTNVAEWLAVQNGVLPSSGITFDPVLRYIRNGRDIGQWVHIDVLFQAYFQAMLTMKHGLNPDPRFRGLAVPFHPSNPYAGSATQIGFGTFGAPFCATLMCEVATRALKAVWFTKWFLHRRLRPEVFAARVHFNLTGARSYPIDRDVLDSQAVANVFGRTGTYLLPQAFPEGSPTHPAYGAGHATVAGACVTILKALFDCERPFVDFATPMTATPDGLSLVPYTEADAGQMTIAGELNKLAMNVAIGRNIAGVHWRSDAAESLKLGEALSISILRENKAMMNESFAGFSFTKFDGTTVTV